MAIGVDIDFKGDKALQSAFNALTGPKQKKAARKGLRAGAKLIADRARQNARFSKRTGKLLKSIKVKAAKRSRSGMGVIVTTGDDGNLFTGETYYGGMVEYGTAKMHARPFLRPAFDTLKDQAAEISRKEIGRAVERIWRTGK